MQPRRRHIVFIENSFDRALRNTGFIVDATRHVPDDVLRRGGASRCLEFRDLHGENLRSIVDLRKSPAGCRIVEIIKLINLILRKGIEYLSTSRDK